MPTRFRLQDDDREWTAAVHGDAVTLDGTGEDVVVADIGDGRFHVAGTAISGVAVEAGGTVWVSIDGDVFAFRISTGGGRRGPSRARDQDALSPPMSATVVRILVAAGDAVRQGDTLVALEAMKMELPIRAPRDGIVRAIRCQEGQLVQPGNALVELAEP